MFVKQATTDRLLGMLVTLATAGALYFIQHRLKLFMGGGRRRGGGSDRRRARDAKKATDYGDPYFRARWGKRGLGLELVQHKGQCMCGRFCFRLLAPAELQALDCPGRIRYPHIFVPAGAFTPLSDLRLLTLYSARSPLVAHVVVHAFCSACGVPVFRASDGAIDTLVVNIECLASDAIRSLEVAYYEDLLGFPPEDSSSSPTPGSATAAGQPYPAKAGAPFSASKGPRRTSPFRPPADRDSSHEGGGVMVPFSGGGGGSSGSRNSSSPRPPSAGGWAGVLPTRLFGVRSVHGGGGGGLGLAGLVRTSGVATSLLSHILSRASLATGAHPRPHRALRQRDVDDDDSDSDAEPEDAELEMAAAAHRHGASSSSSSSSSGMWRSWDESCDVHSRRTGAGSRWGAASGGEGAGFGFGSGSSSRPGSALGLGPASTTTVGTAGAASSLGGALTSARAAAGGASFTNTSNFYRAAAQGKGWERLAPQGCTPPSMHQLRYHLKRHIKRRMNWLHDPEFAALCLDSDEEEGDEQEQEGDEQQQPEPRSSQRPPQYPQPSPQQQQQQQSGRFGASPGQRRLAEEGEYAARAGPSPAPSDLEPHPSTPLGDRTTSYTNHGSSGGRSGQQPSSAASSSAVKSDRSRGSSGSGSGSGSKGRGRENEVPPAPPAVHISEKGKKED